MEYLQSSGTQYINTGLVMTQGFRCLMDVMFVYSAASVSQVLLGAHDPGPPYNRSYFFTTASLQQWGLGCLDEVTFGGPVLGNTLYSLDVSNIYNNIHFIVNGVPQSVGNSDSSGPARSSLPMYLFALNYSNPCYATCRIYSCKIYDPGGTLVADYRPCLDTSGIACMYDNVSKQYLYNSGSGSFTAG